MKTNNTAIKKPLALGVITLIVGIVGLALGIGGTIAYYHFKVKPNATITTTTAPAKTATPAPTTTAPTPVVKAQIKEAAAATSIDKDGKAINTNDSFNAKTDKSIYVVATLDNVAKGSKIEYVRYLNGKYLDSKIATIAKDNLKYYSFVWTSKTTKNEHPAGIYMVKLYLNGEVNEAITYAVK